MHNPRCRLCHHPKDFHEPDQWTAHADRYLACRRALLDADRQTRAPTTDSFSQFGDWVIRSARRRRASDQ